MSNRISTHGVKKLIVTFSLNQSEITVNEVLSIMNVMAPFDKTDFIKSEDVIEKRMIILDSLEKVIRYTFKENRWNYEEIKSTFEIIKGNGFIFKEYWKAPKWNSLKDTYARILINIDENISLTLSWFYSDSTQKLSFYFHRAERRCPWSI